MTKRFKETCDIYLKKIDELKQENSLLQNGIKKYIETITKKYPSINKKDLAILQGLLK